jgi:hypothetical protein
MFQIESVFIRDMILYHTLWAIFKKTNNV